MIVASYWAIQLSLCDIFFHATVQSQKLWWKRPITLANLGIVLSNTVQQRLTDFLLVFYMFSSLEISPERWKHKQTWHKNHPLKTPSHFSLGCGCSHKFLKRSGLYNQTSMACIIICCFLVGCDFGNSQMFQESIRRQSLKMMTTFMTKLWCSHQTQPSRISHHKQNWKNIKH